MRATFSQLLRLDQLERSAALKRMIAAENDLDDPRLVSLTASRFLAWMAMTPDQARSFAHEYDAVADEFNNAALMRHRSTEPIDAEHAEVMPRSALVREVGQDIPDDRSELETHDQRSPPRLRRARPVASARE